MSMFIVGAYGKDTCSTVIELERQAVEILKWCGINRKEIVIEIFVYETLLALFF